MGKYEPRAIRRQVRQAGMTPDGIALATCKSMTRKDPEWSGTQTHC